MISEGHPLRKELSEWVLRENNVRYKEPSASSGSASVVRKESQPEAEPAPDSKDCRQAGSASKPVSNSADWRKIVSNEVYSFCFDQVVYTKAVSRPDQVNYTKAVSRSEFERQTSALTKLFTQDRMQTGRKEPSKSKHLTGNNLRMAFSEWCSPHNLHL